MLNGEFSHADAANDAAVITIYADAPVITYSKPSCNECLSGFPGEGVNGDCGSLEAISTLSLQTGSQWSIPVNSQILQYLVRDYTTLQSM